MAPRVSTASLHNGLMRRIHMAHQVGYGSWRKEPSATRCGATSCHAHDAAQKKRGSLLIWLGETMDWLPLRTIGKAPAGLLRRRRAILLMVKVLFGRQFHQTKQCCTTGSTTMARRACPQNPGDGQNPTGRFLAFPPRESVVLRHRAQLRPGDSSEFPWWCALGKCLMPLECPR